MTRISRRGFIRGLAGAGVMFHRADIQPARTTVNRSYTPEQVIESLRLDSGQHRPLFTPGFAPELCLRHRTAIRSFTQGIRLLRSSQHFIGSLIYSLVSWLTHTLVVYYLLKSFGFDLPIVAAATVMIINTLALMIPVTPGNAGTFEFAVSTALAAFPEVGRADAVLFALALHLLDLLPIAILGFIYLKFERVSISKLKEEHEDEIIFDRMTENGTLVEDEERV